MISTKKITTMALLTAFALIIFMIEAQIPPLVPLTGVKLGLANIITLFALFTLTRRETFCILVMRIVLGSIFSGQPMTMLYSLSGGVLCFVVISIMKNFLSEKSVWTAGVVGAVFHNIGQIIMAVIVTGTPEIVVYFPVLLASGIVTGLFTGFSAQFLLDRYNKIIRKK